MDSHEQLNLFYEAVDIKEELDTRVCIECQEKKSVKYFELSINGYLGIRGTCKECRNKSKQIRRHHRKNWGYPDEDYECPICGKKQEGKSRNGKAWAVDHCHKTDKVRGYLCPTCNSGMGLLNDDINLLEKSIEWLRKHEGEE